MVGFSTAPATWGLADISRGSPVLTYQVVFDEPLYGDDGDGPYPFMEIEANALSRLSD